LPVTTTFAQKLRDDDLDIATYSGIWGNPMASMVRGGVDAYRAHGADAVIGFGGGAALDVAKVVAMMATNAGDDVLEYAWDHPKVRAIENELPYFIALPTTSGTGSEVGRSSVVSDDSTHVKKIVFSPKLLARVVFADPGADARPAAEGHRGDRDGRADAQRRVVPVARRITRFATASRSKACGSRRGAADRGRRREEPPGAERHDDGVDDGRDRVPEGPGRRPLVRACAVDGRRPASRPRQRDHDRPRDALQRAGGDGEDGRDGAGRRSRRRRGDDEASAAAFIDWLQALKAKLGIPAKLGEAGVERRRSMR
jgi:hypothetical protein